MGKNFNVLLNTQNEERIRVMLDSVPFKQKPENSDICRISKRIGKTAPQELTVNEIVSRITNGYSICPGVLKGGGRKSTNWTEQQLILVDLDNKVENGSILTADDILRKCEKNNIKPSFIIPTFSSTPKHERFRVGFILDKIITDAKQILFIIKTLIKVFNADKACKDLARVFYGTNKDVVYVDESARFSFEDIVAINNKLIENKTSIADVQAQEASEKYPYNLKEEKENFDLESFLRSECSNISCEGENYIKFSICPICGHKEDFVYYKDSKRFQCFSSSDGRGGNIIDYLMITRKLSKGDAIRYFLYDILGHKKPVTDCSSQTLIPIQQNETNDAIQLLVDFNGLKQPPEKYSFDDKGMSRLFASVYKKYLRHNADIKCWMFFNGKVWVKDIGSNIVNQKMKYFCDALAVYSCSSNLYKDIKNPQDKLNKISEFQKFIKKLGSKTRRDLIVKDAQSEFPIYEKDLDADLNLFNCQNGTLNLETFEFKEHDPNDFLSKISNVYYNAEVSTEIFDKFTGKIMENDTEKIRFLQKSLGYALTSKTNEEAFFIFYGATTRNGKSTLTDTILYLMGDYGIQTIPETIALKSINDSRSASGDIARLKGARYVNISELPSTMILNTSLIKTLTGGDTITARMLYQNEIQFKPQFKMFINTNYLPQINDNTFFTSNRVYVIPFEKHFEPQEQDKSLKYKLREQNTLSGIFNWCLEGLKRYQKEGLNPPQCVLDANKEYQLHADNITRFLEDCFCTSQNSTKLQIAYDIYHKWCEANGITPELKSIFNSKLQNKGITATINGTRNMLKCLEVKNDNLF